MKILGKYFSEFFQLSNSGETPPDFKPFTKNRKPNYWHSKIFNGGHLFHCPHPQLNLELSFIRGWALFSAFQPRISMGIDDCIKGFSLDTFAAILGLLKIKSKNRSSFLKIVDEISSYWGTVSIFSTGEIVIRYGLDKEIENKISSTQSLNFLELQYGTLESEVFQKLRYSTEGDYLVISDQKISGSEIKKTAAVSTNESTPQKRKTAPTLAPIKGKPTEKYPPQKENPKAKKPPKEENPPPKEPPQKDNFLEKAAPALQNSAIETVFRNSINTRNSSLTRNGILEAKKTEENELINAFKKRIEKLKGKIRAELVEIASKNLEGLIASGKFSAGVFESLLEQLERVSQNQKPLTV